MFAFKSLCQHTGNADTVCCHQRNNAQGYYGIEGYWTSKVDNRHYDGEGTSDVAGVDGHVELWIYLRIGAQAVRL